jgi:hypothetical protein
MPFPPPVLISMPCGPHPGPPPASTVGRYRYSDGPCSGVRCFAKGRGLKIAAYYIENESGASLKRPELFRLLEDSHPDDVLLIEQVAAYHGLAAKTG